MSLDDDWSDLGYPRARLPGQEDRLARPFFSPADHLYMSLCTATRVEIGERLLVPFTVVGNDWHVSGSVPDGRHGHIEYVGFHRRREGGPTLLALPCHHWFEGKWAALFFKIKGGL